MQILVYLYSLVVQAGGRTEWYSDTTTRPTRVASGSCEGVTIAFTAQAQRQLHVLGLDGDTLGVNGAQLSVLEQAHQIRLCGLLQRAQSVHLQSLHLSGVRETQRRTLSQYKRTQDHRAHPVHGL